MRGILAALDVAHQARVIHGAVIPSHVLIRPGSEQVVLIGWGQAALWSNEKVGEIEYLIPRHLDWLPKDQKTPFPLLPAVPETDLRFAGQTAMSLWCSVDPKQLPVDFYQLLIGLINGKHSTLSALMALKTVQEAMFPERESGVLEMWDQNRDGRIL
jgi:hypothetical protein